ncbi:MAG: ATP-binding protein [Bacteroidales bacterium]|nr:ATP-binding protein [Bacteroidales bacterium]
MKQYFVIHAARQSGKTTFLRELTQQLNNEGKYYALYCTVESVQEVIQAEIGIPALVRTIKKYVNYSQLPLKEEFAKNPDYENFTNILNIVLSDYCVLLDKPLVIFFDEADCLSEDTLISFLRQLRSGYNDRGYTPFVHSIALVGIRNIKDYRWKVRPDSESRHTSSPFNIVTEVLSISNFTIAQVWELYRQHTEETGQIFEEEAVEYIYAQTQGQPWLVNAIAREVIQKLLDWDYTKPVTKALAEQAIHNIIIRRDTHIDQLLEKLKEPRVRSVVEPLLLGGYIDTYSEEFSYVSDLGIIRKTPDKIEFSNPIYNEVITRTLNGDLQDSLLRNKKEYDIPKYFRNGSIDMALLMGDFQQFWRENSGIWKERFEYKEAAPHLILMAFLQRVINGGGDIIREYAADSDRCDLNILYKDRRYPIELKIRHGEKSLAKGLEQLAGYMDTLGCNEGWLVIFDQRTDLTWDEKIYQKPYPLENGKIITVIGA